MKRIAIFDLDGTLLNTISDLGQACNHALSSMGYPTYPLDAYPMMVGNGITRLIERALPADHCDPVTVNRARELFLQFYNVHCTDLTIPYPGIPELLRNLTDRGVMIAVTSNKFHSGTVALIDHFFGNLPWTAIEGQRDPRPTKPAPDIVYDVLNKAGVTAADALYIGDSGVDMDTAANAGIESVGVTWGFRDESELRSHGATHIVHTPEQILDHI
ncbi:MAG: HAD family hydrolase [Clostridiales bacterium]|nr:HAD family hydrolase [Clostridiales bacterium]